MSAVNGARGGIQQWRPRMRSCAGRLGAATQKLAHQLPTILSVMALAKAIGTVRIHHIAGRTGDRTAWVTTHPFRAPH